MSGFQLGDAKCTAFLDPTKARGGCNREGGEEIEGPIKGAVMGGSNYALMQVGRAPEYVHCFFSPHGGDGVWKLIHRQDKLGHNTTYEHEAVLLPTPKISTITSLCLYNNYYYYTIATTSYNFLQLPLIPSSLLQYSILRSKFYAFVRNGSERNINDSNTSGSGTAKAVGSSIYFSPHLYV